MIDVTSHEMPISARRRLRAPFLWIAGLAIAFVWTTSVLGIALALADSGASGWWLVLPFGLAPLAGLIMVIDRAVRSPELEAAGHSPGDIVPAMDEPPIVDELTDREREVLALLSTGRTNGEMARDLFIAVGTVKSHVNSICRKLGARNRTEAVTRARHLELVS